MPKFCACGRFTCPICKGKPRNVPVNKSDTSVNKRPTPVDAPVTKPPSGDATVNIRDSTVTVECACGCEKTVVVKIGKRYATPSCRTKAWRKKEVS